MANYRGYTNKKVADARADLDTHTRGCRKCDTNIPDDASERGFTLCGKGAKLYAAFQTARRAA
jgi:hypothetical protein